MLMGDGEIAARHQVKKKCWAASKLPWLASQTSIFYIVAVVVVAAAVLI